MLGCFTNQTKIDARAISCAPRSLAKYVHEDPGSETLASLHKKDQVDMRTSRASWRDGSVLNED